MTFDPTYLLANKIFLVLIIIVTTWLAFWVYSADPRNKINRLFALMSLSFLFWWAGGYFFAFSRNLELSLWFGRIILGVVSISFTLLYFFIVIFPYETKRNKILDKVIIFFAIVFFFFPILTDLVVKGVKFSEFGINPVFGTGQILYYGWIAVIMILIFIQLLLKYFRISKEMRIRIQYVFLGFLIFILMNLVFNVIFPLWTGTIKYWQLGNYSSLFVLGFTGYAIVARELFGIRVILTQALVGVIAILLLWQTVISDNLLEFAWKFILFLLFLIFGYFLVQSIIREIQRRAEIQRLYQELAKLDEAKTEFMSIVSHQLRTPLTAIKGYASMVKEGIYGKFSEKIKKPLNNILISSERLIKFINDILNVTRIETGRIELSFERVGVEEIISSIIEELEVKAKEKNLYLKWEKPKERLPNLTIDRAKIRQVILNLIDNAIKYTNEGGVKVECEVKKGKYVISVSDTGAGMSKEDIAKLFRSFSRGESGVTYYKEGTGLGLYIARQFAEMHGGKVWAESKGKGKGSTFYIELSLK